MKKQLIWIILFSIIIGYYFLKWFGKFFGIIGILISIIYFIYDYFLNKDIPKNILNPEDKGSKNSIVFTNTAMFFFPSLTLYFLGTFVNPNYSWCECKEISGDAITYSVLRGEYDSSVDIDALEKCAEKTIDLVDLDLDPDEVSANYITQVSYEMCKNGYYEGKGSNNRGKRFD